MTRHEISALYKKDKINIREKCSLEISSPHQVIIQLNSTSFYTYTPNQTDLFIKCPKNMWNVVTNLLKVLIQRASEKINQLRQEQRENNIILSLSSARLLNKSADLPSLPNPRRK